MDENRLLHVRQLEEDLFKRWSCNRKSFISDGIVNEEAFLSSKYKIGFLLKEVNSQEPFWDLRKYVSGGAQAASWNNITRWIIGINNLESDLDWSRLKDISHEMRKEYLNQVAVINLKKSNGGATSDMNEISDHATNDKIFLKEQIDKYNLDLLICCGTSDVYHNEVETDKKEWKMSRKGVWYYKKSNGGHVVAWYHPQWNVASNMLYFPLVDTIKEILE